MNMVNYSRRWWSYCGARPGWLDQRRLAGWRTSCTARPSCCGRIEARQFDLFGSKEDEDTAPGHRLREE